MLRTIAVPASLLHMFAMAHQVATASSNTKRRTVLAIAKGSRMPQNILQHATCINTALEASATMSGM